MKKAVHFEIPCDDMVRAGDFYQKVFGWKLKDMSMEAGVEYHVAHTGPTGEDGMTSEPGFINGTLMPRTEKITGPVIVMKTEDIHETLKLIEESGGEKLSEPVAIGDMGWYAYAKDCESNVIGVWQDMKV